MIDAMSMATYWPSMGHWATGIGAKGVTRFREKALAYSSVTNWL
jgi:hypothetical protein